MARPNSGRPILPGMRVSTSLIPGPTSTRLPSSSIATSTVRFSCQVPEGSSPAAQQEGNIGEPLVLEVVKAIGDLEKGAHPGPFVAVLGNRLFAEAHKPVPNSMVLPADRILPMLNGSLFRCGQIQPETGIVVSLGGSDIDIVVATPPKAQFLQVTQDAKYLFRVYEKFMLRIKDPDAVKRLELPPF